MKTATKKILLVVLMFGTLVNYAGNKNLDYTASDAKKVRVEFKSVKKGQHITIKNESGLEIYNQAIENAGNYSKLFNLSSLINGIYTVELNKDYEILVKTFKIENKLVTFLSEENKKLYKPIIRTENNLVLISKINFDNKSTKIVIYYKDEVILSETIKGNGVLNKVYKLSENEKGNYSIVINTDNRTYVQEFAI